MCFATANAAVVPRTGGSDVISNLYRWKRRGSTQTFMQFLTISRRKNGNGDPTALATEESRSAQTLYSEGSIRQIWHRDDIPGACILWEAESEEQVREMLNSLPFARAELIEFSIIPLKPYAGFTCLAERP